MPLSLVGGVTFSDFDSLVPSSLEERVSMDEGTRGWAAALGTETGKIGRSLSLCLLTMALLSCSSFSEDIQCSSEVLTWEQAPNEHGSGRLFLIELQVENGISAFSFHGKCF